MGCCFSVKSVLTASKPPRAGVTQSGGPFQRFSGVSTLDEMPPSTGKFTVSTPVGKTTVQSDTSGTEGSPGSDTDAAEFHRFTSYYGNTATEDVSLRILRRGVVKFNVNQKQGIEYLIKHSLIRRDAEEIAWFLRHDGKLVDGRWCGEHLNHKAVGEYLGSIGGRDDEGREFQRGVLRAYASSFNFQGLSLIPSLRAFLAEFRLPGEAQVIDRVMGGFSDTYVRDNPGVFSSPDVAYVLAFAAIMLNTDLHKSGVKRKMTREQFVSNMRGLEAGGKDLSQALLQEVYGDIARAPLALDTDPSFLTFFRPARQGWLLKRCTGTVPRWKRRFFLLADGVLYYFSSQGDVTTGRPRCILPLDEAALQVVGSLAFRLVPRAVAGEGGGGGGHPLSTPLKGGGGGIVLGAPLSGTTPVAPSSPLPPFPSPSGSSSGGGGGGGGGVSLLGGGHHHPHLPPPPTQRPPLSSITEALKCAKRNKDGSVKRSTRAHFELQASTPQERDEWAEAIAAQLVGAWGGSGGGASSMLFSTPSKQPPTPARHDGASSAAATAAGVSGGGGGAGQHSFGSSTAPTTSSQATAPQGSTPNNSNSQGTVTLGGGVGVLPLTHHRVSFSGSPSLRALAVSVVSAFPPTPPPPGIEREHLPR